MTFSNVRLRIPIEQSVMLWSGSLVSKARPDVPDDVRSWLDSMDEHDLKNSLDAIAESCRNAGFAPSMRACHDLRKQGHGMPPRADELTPLALRMCDGETDGEGMDTSLDLCHSTCGRRGLIVMVSCSESHLHHFEAVVFEVLFVEGIIPWIRHFQNLGALSAAADSVLALGLGFLL